MSWGPRQTLIDGYNKFVIKNPDGCWGWSGCAPKNPGYGQFRSDMKIMRAHRASWIIHHGDIPKGLCVLHSCDNPICSNPRHLFLGSHSDNMLDSIKKNRNKSIGAFGEKNHQAKLNRSDVKKIRELIANSVAYKEIAKFFGVHLSRISDIKCGRTWAETSTGRAL